MKTLVLCVDRDDDIGVKTGIKGPLVGREDNLAAAVKLGLADPEDSDVNALLSAIGIYDGLEKEGLDAEVATITGDVRVGSVSDLVLTQQLDRVLEEVRPDRVFLVSDGVEDEAFAPILSSRIRIDHVRRVFVRQTPTAESLYYVLARQMKNPKVRRKIIAPMGFVLLLFGLIYWLSPFAAAPLALIMAGLYLILISLPFQSFGELIESIRASYERVRERVASGDLSIFFDAAAVILVLVGVSFGLDLAQRTYTGYVAQVLTGAFGALWWFILAALAYEGGKVLSAYFRHGRVPRHVLAVAGTFVAVGLLVVAFIQVLQLIFGEFAAASLPLVYLSLGVAVFLVVATGWSYRTQQETPASEDSWRH